MKKKTFLFLIIVVLSMGSIVAQTKRRAPTKSQTPASAKTAPAAKSGKLEIEAGLIFKSGDTKPVARATFRLLKKDALSLIRTEETYQAFLSEGSTRISGYPTYESFNAETAMLWYGSRYSDKFTPIVNQNLDRESVGTMTTGFDGKGVFESVPLGDYFLFGKYSWGDRSGNEAAWNVPVTIKAGTNKLILDNNNTAY